MASSRSLFGASSRNSRERRPSQNSNSQSHNDNYEEDLDESGLGSESDVRISKLTRLMARLESEESFLKACMQIEELILRSGENRRYIVRCFHCLSVQFNEVLHGLSSLLWKDVAIIKFAELLLRVLNCMEGQHGRFWQWLLEFIDRKAQSTRHLESALNGHSIIVRITPSLTKPQCKTLIAAVKEVLELAPNVEIFKIYASLFVNCLLPFERTKMSHFQDFVDIVIGWLVDENEDSELIPHVCKEVLRLLRSYFVEDIDFTRSFLVQILEDMEGSTNSATIGTNEKIIKVIRLVRGFSTIANVTSEWDKEFVVQSGEKILSSANVLFNSSDGDERTAALRHKLMLVIIEFLAVGHAFDGVSARIFLNGLLDMFLLNNGWQNWSIIVLNDFLLGLISWIESIVTLNQLESDAILIVNHTLELIDLLLRANIPFDTRRLLIRMVQGLFRTRTVGLLQDIYDWLLKKLEIGCGAATHGEAVESKLFVLSCLSDIATNKTGSILGLWALSPSIFDVLMGLIENDEVDQQCLLELLRAHCSAHSYFVSSVALSRSFVHESSPQTPGTRYLNTLMKFWTEKLFSQVVSPLHQIWRFDWISEFIKTSSQHFYILVESGQGFYTTIIRQMSEKADLKECLATLLDWMMDDVNYQKSEFIIKLIRETCIRILLKEETEHIKDIYSSLLQRTPFVLMIVPEIEDTCLSNEADKPGKEKQADGVIPTLTTPEFNYFIQELFLFEKNEPPVLLVGCSTPTIIKASVDFLIQSKLKTSMGRPQDFFFHLENMLKKYRVVRKIPNWKLSFIFELERRVLGCIYESYVISSEMSESHRSYYFTNRTPCTEWLKRMRPDLVDLALASKNYPALYYYATHSADELKARYALLELEDLEGLVGLNEMAGYHYAKGEYDKVQSFVKDGGPDILKELIAKRTETILKTASGDLQNWQNNEPSPEDFIFQIHSKYKTFVNVQLSCLTDGKVFPESISGELDFLSQYGILDLVKIRALLIRKPDLLSDQKVILDCIILNRMVELGNLTFVKEWLSCHTWEDMQERLNTSVRVKVEYFNILAEFLYRDQQLDQCSKICVSLLQILDSEGDSLKVNFKTQILLRLAQKLIGSDDLFYALQQNSSDFSGTELKEPAIMSILEKATQACPEMETIWFEWARYADKRADEESTDYLKEVYKTTASHSYCQMFRDENRPANSKMALLAMTRLIKLHKEGFNFNPEEVIIDSKWLTFLPELAHIEEFRAHLIGRFPEQTTFHIATYVKPQKFVRLSQRRGVFDASAYSVTETNDDPIQTACSGNQCDYPTHVLSDLGIAVGEEPEIQESLTTAALRAIIPKCCTLMVQEMERIGTSREELWSWSLQRVAGDLGKRLAALRKDVLNSNSLNTDVLNVEKVKAFVAPILSYLSELWKQTKECDTAAELAFVCRNEEAIRIFLESLTICTNVENLDEIMDSLMRYVAGFDSYLCSKLSMANLSPLLANFDFSDPTAKISLPGFPSGVTVAGIHPVVKCLATKTKPKRIMFLGSNGKKYEYLVKGNENLNIDSRIMQLLKATENFTEYPSRTYSVTPLGGRGGLIQIVEGAIPLFSLYKKYLNRNNKPERPSEMFWRKLEAMGFIDRSNPAILLAVFDGLVEDTSSELFSRELFLCAEDSSGWYNSVRNFTRDSAVGSCIGYIVGVGDRHLDNILLNPAKGHLVHVDFSLLFGRGASLRIPEKVPFRLTPNFVAALQYPGLPGPYHAYLNRLLHQFQDNKEIVEFCVESIAYAYQIEDSLPVDPRILLSVELRSALKLLQLRAVKVLSSVQHFMREVPEMSTDTRNAVNAWSTRLDITNDRIHKLAYRWRRELANIDPIIQFVISHAQPLGALEIFRNLVLNEWNPNVIHFWCHSKIEELCTATPSFSQRLDFAETTLQLLIRHIPDPDDTLKPRESIFANSNSEQVDTKKMGNVMKGVKARISAVGLSTANELTQMAISRENLSQMYEGWTAWV